MDRLNRDRRLIQPDYPIGDTAELVPASALNQRGPVQGVIRTSGGDGEAQLLTVTVVGSGNYESSAADPEQPRGPLVALVEWAIKGARARAELDIPQGGITFSVVASWVQVSARYDGRLVVNGAQLDPLATGGTDPSPRQRVGAMVGYGSYARHRRLTRTFRFNDIGPPVPDVDGPQPQRTPPVRVPPFARRVLVLGQHLGNVGYRLRFGTVEPADTNDFTFTVGARPDWVDLPSDCGFVELENDGPGSLANPGLMFEILL